MRRPGRGLLLGLAVWLAVAAHAAAAPPEPGRQIMVLLRLPPEHFRAGAGYSGDYGDGLGHSGRQRIAEQLAREHGLTLTDDWPMPVVGVECFVMTVPDGRSPADEMASLAQDKRVDSVEPINLYRAQARSGPAGGSAGGSASRSGAGAAEPNDPLFRAQPAAKAWRLADLHQLATGRGVRVAVIDSTVDARHPDLAGQVALSRNFVTGGGEAPEQHGTGVAGVIAALADNGQGIAGIAPHARLMALRACWQQATGPNGAADTVCDSLSLAKALEFAITHDAQVINLSLSGPPDPLLGRLLDAALARGLTVVGAFDGALPDGGFPASHAGVIAVSDDPAGPKPGSTYVAPGRNVPTTQPQGRWFLVNGSSYAAAHVSGLFALLREEKSSARGAAALVAAHHGGGVIDACASLIQAAGSRECAHPPESMARALALAAAGGSPAGGRSGAGAGRR